jgi:hypothetical protein
MDEDRDMCMPRTLIPKYEKKQRRRGKTMRTYRSTEVADEDED